MKHVKGTMLVKMVKIMRADKSGVYDKYLTEEDKNVMSKTVLASSWYPWDVYKRCFNALADVHAKGDMEVCRQWGRAESKWLTEGVYKTVLTGKNPKSAFQKLELFWKLMFDFGQSDVNFISDNELKITFKDYDSDFKVFFWYVRGWYEEVLRMCNCKDVQSEFLVKSWEAGGETAIQLSWT